MRACQVERRSTRRRERRVVLGSSPGSRYRRREQEAGRPKGSRRRAAVCGVAAPPHTISQQPARQNGPISVRDCSGDIDAQAQNGPIEVSGGGGRQRLHTQNGPIEVSLPARSGTGRAWKPERSTGRWSWSSRQAISRAPSWSHWVTLRFAAMARPAPARAGAGTIVTSAWSSARGPRWSVSPRKTDPSRSAATRIATRTKKME
jgi:hypothetical protein